MLKIGWIILLVPLVSPAAVAQAPAPTGPDLTGLGRFDFPFNSYDFSKFAPSLVDDTVDVTLTIDKRGAVTDCESVPSPNSAGSQLCQAAQKGHLQVPVWYAPAMQGGHLTLHMDAVLERAVPVKPIRFVEPQQGLAVRLAVPSDTCKVLDPKMDPADAQAVCAAFDADGRPGLKGDPGWRYADTALLVDPNRQVYRVMTSPVIVDRGQPVKFADPAVTASKLGAEDGKLRVLLSEDNYPNLDISGSVKVLLGFDRSGKAQTCWPINSTNSAYLAYWTCEKLIANTSFDGALFPNARFDFVRGAPKYEGLRYSYFGIRWQVPDR